MVLIFLVVIPFSGFAHFIFFPQQTRCILIDYSEFSKEGSLYFNSNTPQNKLDTIKSIIQLASNRVASFWGQKTCHPTFIYCENSRDFKKFGSPYPFPAMTHMKFCSYIVISDQGVDADILAHEISHAEFYQRLGFYTWSFKIPRWFDEGLAMQNDNRSYYSEDTLKARSNNFKNLRDVKKFISGKQFSEEGTPEQVTLNFMTAKHIVNKWYTKEKLDNFIKDMNSGKSFEDAFGR